MRLISYYRLRLPKGPYAPESEKGNVKLLLRTPAAAPAKYPRRQNRGFLFPHTTGAARCPGIHVEIRSTDSRSES
jgi:hypothetical protein